MSVEIVDTAAVELPLICRNSSAMVRCSSVRSILSSTTSVHSAVSNSEIGTSALVCGGSGNTLVHSVVGADTLVSGHSVNTLVNSAIGSDPVVRCSSVSSLGSEDEGFICASTPVTKVSHHTQVRMASIRHLPRLKRARDEDHQSEPADMYCSPFKQLKLSPIHKCGPASTATLRDPRAVCLRSRGQLKISVYVNCGLLTVNVVQAKHLSSKYKPTCDSIVKMSLVPGDVSRSSCHTQTVHGSNNPLFDERVSFELLEGDRDKRLLISVWNHIPDQKVNELLGCMSFGIKSLLTCNKTVGGWYYLLTESVGQKKHLQVSSSKEAILQDRSNFWDAALSKNRSAMEAITIVVKRGRSGYGFSLTGSSPAQICRVEEGSHAEHSGLRKNDQIVKINGQNVSGSSADSVARIVRQSQKQIILDVERVRAVETLEPCSRKPVHGELIREQASLHGILSVEEQCKENGVDVGRRRQMRGTTTAKPQVSLTYQDLTPLERSRQSAIQELVQHEEEYVRVMQFGIQHYSRPLRHHILTSQEHALLFQNLEKLAALSEFHASQLHENSLKYCDIDLPDDKFVDTVGSIYQPKVTFLCEAYETYCSGLRRAERILNRFKITKQFQKFIQDTTLDAGQPDISAFINRPAEHLRSVLTHLQAVLMKTNKEHHDNADLAHVVSVIQHSCNKINEMTLHASATAAYDNKASANHKYGHSVMSSELSQSSISTEANGTVCVDPEVLDLQRRLLFARNVQAFQLATPTRHVIYSGELLQVEGRKWAKLWAILFNDLLLLTKVETDGYVTVLEEPMHLKTVTSTEFDCEHPSEFVIGVETHTTDDTKASYDLRRVTLRAPTIEQKFVWKSIIEHRILAGKVGRDSVLLPFKVGELVENFGVL